MPDPNFCLRNLVFTVLKIVTICAIIPSTLNAQDDTIRRKNTFLGYPIAFYLPETRWGIGAAGLYNFYISREDPLSPPSQVQLGFAFTQNDQFLLYIPFDLYWNQRKNILSGELSYNRYSYYFFGTGKSAPDDLKEPYEVRFPRMRINYLHEIVKHIYAGARYWYEDYDIYEKEPGGFLESGAVPGGDGSISSGPGIVFLYDSRDNVYQALHGNYLEIVYHNQSELFGSTHWFDRYRFDARKYIPTGKKQALALNLFGDFLKGDVPFNQMASIGSAKRMRGYYEGRYRDKNILLFQTEYRANIYRRWGGVVFFNSSMLSEKISGFHTGSVKLSGGAGIRFAFDREKRINFRLDYALGKNSSAVYFTAGEAF